MKYWTIDGAQHAATRLPAEMRSAVSSSGRLERWAALLDDHADGALGLLFETEFKSEESRSALRESISPISIAFADSALRAQGLAGDTYGDAHGFFGLSHGTLHEILCYCHYRSSKVSSAEIAARVRRAARRAERIERITSALGLYGTRAGASLVRMYA